MAFPVAPNTTTTIRASSVAIYFQCFPGKGGPDPFRGISGVSYVLKVNGVADGSGTKTTDASGKVEISMAIVTQMQAGTPVTLEIFGTTFDLSIVATLEAATTVAGRQRRLSMLGYELGPIDGTLGMTTDRAALNFQADAGLDPDGVIGKVTQPLLTDAFGE